MIYADFNFYSAEFLGNKIPEENFDFYALRASEELDSRTFGRIGEVTPDIKKACCGVAEVLYSEGISISNSENRINSEKVGDYSVSYFEPSENYEKTVNKKINSELKKYLGNTGLLYGGV